MGKKLVIIESPGKIKKFRASLGSEYDVLASYGHVADLPEKKLSVNIRKQFEPTYEIYPDKKAVVNEIVSKAKKADIVYLMTDLDREGTAIAWHVARYLPKGIPFKRASTGAITKDAILKGIKNASDIDMDMVSSYEARRILDRLVGYKCSFITKQATGGKSVGRTQSAGLRILADRENEIIGFVPIVYWPVAAKLLTECDHLINARIKKPKELSISTQEEANKICETFRKGPVKVIKFEKKAVNSKPYAPFTTSSMYQSAAAIMGWKSAKTASVAQKLYEAGAITYHRTDSTYIVPEFIKEVRSLVSNDYGSEYVPSKAYVWAKTKGAQEAHEACRVTEVSLHQYTSGGVDEKRLYEVIWKRTIASQMSEMKVERISVEFGCKSYVLAATGAKILFNGFRLVWDYGKVDENMIPSLKVGDKVKVVEISTEKKETQPPSRYTESSLVKKLESEGIGRPSTFAAIPKTLEARGYIKNNKNISVTELGLKVDHFLVAAEFCFADISFTAKMEDQLDKIAEKKLDKLGVLTTFWHRLRDDLKNAEKIRLEASRTDFKCPECAKNKEDSILLMKHSNFGSFFSCEKYSDKEKPCKYKAQVGEKGEPVQFEKKEVVESEIDCPKCGKKLVIRQGKKTFLGCPSYPKCKGLYNLDGEAIDFSKKKKWKKKKKKDE